MEKEYLQLLGTTQRDKPTGFTGMVSSISFDAYGCIMAFLSPPVNKEGKIQDGNWFDVKRLEPKGKRIMPVPDFGDGIKSDRREAGGAHKPALPSGPGR